MKETYRNSPELLQKAASGDKEAMDEIVRSNLGLVKSIAVRFLGRGCEMEDLIQIGAMGMMKAILHFEPERECRFTTYAVPLIIGEIKRFLRDDGWIKISRDAKTNAAKIFRFCGEYEQQHGFSPTMEEICRTLSLKEEDAVFAMEAARPAVSLYAEDEETGFSPEKAVGEDNIEKAIGKIALMEAIERLSPQEQRLIRLRYFRSMTQSQTALLLGLTQVKVSREEKKIIAKLRENLSESA